MTNEDVRLRKAVLRASSEVPHKAVRDKIEDWIVDPTADRAQIAILGLIILLTGDMEEDRP